MFQKYYVVLNTAYCKTTRSIKIFDGKHLSDRNLLWIQAKATPMEQLLQSGNCFVFLQVKKIEKITLMQGACAWAVPACGTDRFSFVGIVWLAKGTGVSNVHASLVN